MARLMMKVQAIIIGLIVVGSISVEARKVISEFEPNFQMGDSNTGHHLRSKPTPNCW
ncbi:hypothetical protein MANES_10G110801v8 [Manihot esculenta]|uniref:Uncharacterized protein n=1 Tax=Manihot esculenta TaxID=3983 RepID=A0ACB7H258_MANES|nr:hypothetical protein MANES_10G110801v8 [Manihot esculenta]